MKKIALMMALVAGVLFTSCDLNFFPSDELNSDVLLQDEAGAAYIMDGCYAFLKDEIDFLGYASGNTFTRHYFQLSEFPADNTSLSSHTTDPLYEATAYAMTDNLKNVGTLWMVAYKAIYMANTVIASFDEGKSANGDQLLGEAYFMRALMHLNLVTLYAKPYSHGRDNIGIPLHISTSNETITRAKVGDVYDQIVKDFTKASELMGASRGNKGYPSKDAALGMLSRVHLYMENWEAVVNTVNTMLAGATPASKLEKDFVALFPNAKTATETLFCIAHETTDTRGQSSIGSMYLKDGMGWGEIYPSNTLLYLYERYPSDVRYSGIILPQYLAAGTMTAYLPIEAQEGGISTGRSNMIAPATPAGDNFTCTVDGTTYTIEKRTINGEYTEYWMNYKGEDVQVRVHPVMQNRKQIPMYYINKFSYQDGDPMLSSPIVCRWGEVILNRAEAYAHMGGKDAEALADVNVLRTRAGIPAEGMFSAASMHGYASALDVVLDERRLELAFEGHRLFDLIRNKRTIDRRFPGAQPWEIVQPDYPKLQYPIPNNEWTVSGIQQNPTY